MENRKTTIIISLVLISVAIFLGFITPLPYFSNPYPILIGLGFALAYTTYLEKNRKINTASKYTKDHSFSETLWIILAFAIDMAIYFSEVGGLFGNCNNTFMYPVLLVSYLYLMRGIFVVSRANSNNVWLSLLAINLYLTFAIALYYGTLYAAMFAFLWC